MINVVHDPQNNTLDVHGAASPIGVRVDAGSGLPLGLVDRDDPSDVTPLSLVLEVVWGGTEATRPIGGLEHRDAQRQQLSGLRLVASRSEDLGGADRFVTTARDGDWEIDLHYDFRDRSPHVGLAITTRRAPGAGRVQLRDLAVGLRLALEDLAGWRLHAPGNQLRSDVELAAVSEPLRIFSPADTFGSPGFIALGNDAAPRTTVIWPICHTELGSGRFIADGEGGALTLGTGLAGWVDEQGGLTWGTIHLQTERRPWSDVREDVGAWYTGLGIAAPADAPAWLGEAHVYEAHIGFSVFADGQRYEKYASPADLQADLPRIQGLGFDVVQLMPRHPYPSYNVHDYADVSTTYGDEAQLRELVADCHRRGMHVLLDVILHGVIDQEVMDDTLAGVHAGPYADRLADGTLEYLLDTAEDVAWSRHIVEYAPYWHAGSPARSPLADAQPEWFMRDSEGAITRRYTKAFDIASPSWQRYFLDACLDVTERLGTDGFRIDAPTYNNYATWAEGRPYRASYGAMASLPLLAELRTRLRAVYPEAVVYTEPTGALFRAVSDATYNYDEHWLVESLMADADNPQRDWRLVRNARELARWLSDRDGALPPGAGIIHHIDSHDSIWWRLPGAQWRRERFGTEAAVGLLAVFALAARGGFMTFMGGEEQIEDELRRAHELRRQLPELAAGACEYLPDAASSEDVLVAVRRHGSDVTVVVVNLADGEVRCDVALDGLTFGEAFDHWGGEALDVAGAGGLSLTLGAYQPRVIRLS
jgi:Alpha amylase, catalytic domain